MSCSQSPHRRALLEGKGKRARMVHFAITALAEHSPPQSLLKPVQAQRTVEQRTSAISGWRNNGMGTGATRCEGSSTWQPSDTATQVGGLHAGIGRCIIVARRVAPSHCTTFQEYNSSKRVDMRNIICCAEGVSANRQGIIVGSQTCRAVTNETHNVNRLQCEQPCLPSTECPGLCATIAFYPIFMNQPNYSRMLLSTLPPNVAHPHQRVFPFSRAAATTSNFDCVLERSVCRRRRIWCFFGGQTLFSPALRLQPAKT